MPTDDPRAIVARALAKTTPDAAADKLLMEAFEAAEFPRVPSFHASVYPLPASLTPAQRIVAEASCDDRFERLLDDLWAMPYQKPWRKQWLGLTPPTALETTMVGEQPLWRALQLDRSRSAASAIFNALPFAEALPAIAALLAGGAVYKLTGQQTLFAEGNLRLVSELRAEGEKWALRFVAETHDERSLPDICPYVFLALVRAKVPIAPHLDAYFPAKPAAVGEAIYRELSRALPADRRDHVLAPNMARMPAEWVVGLLEELASPALVKALLEAQPPDSQHWRSWTERLGTLGKQNPGIAAALEAVVAAAPVPVELRLAASVRVSAPAKLDAIQRKQVLRAGKLFDGKSLRLEQRIGTKGPSEEPADGINSFFGSVELRRLADAAGEPRFDIVLVDSGAGTIFVADTVTDIGYVLDFGVVLKRDDAALRMGLAVHVGVKPATSSSKRAPRKRAPRRRSRSRSSRYLRRDRRSPT